MSTVYCVRSFALAIAAVALTGCGGLGTIFKTYQLDDGTSLSTGARQRVVTNIEPGVASRTGRVDPQRIVCVEPSPDVAVAVANAMGASVGIIGQGSGAISGSQAEGVAQLAERTTAIQAILKQGHQACLDYANGAISGTTYSLRQSRLDDLLVTMILSEHVSGAFGRSGAAIGTKSFAESQASIASLAAGTDQLDKLQADLNDADKQVEKEKEELDEAEEALKKAEDEKKEQKEIDGLKQKRDAKKAQLAAAEAKRDTLLARLRATSDTVAKASSEVTKAVGVGGITANVSDARAKIIGDMQARFVEKDVNQAVISTCLTELGLWMNENARTDPALQRFMLQRITGTGGEAADLQDVDITLEEMQDFFLARQITAQNRLTDFCDDNLEDLVRVSFANRHDLQLKELELEGKRLDIQRRQFEQQASKPSDIHPIVAFNALKQETPTFKKLLDTLVNKAIPAVSASFPQDQHDGLAKEKSGLVAEAKAVHGQAITAIAPAEQQAVKALEDRWLALVGDPRRSGTANQRRAWKASFDGQQADAEAKVIELKKVIKKLDGLSDEINSLLTRINQVS